MKPWVKEYGSLWKLCHATAEVLGVHSSTPWRWYEGVGLPTLYNLVQFADEYEVSIDYLLGRTAARELKGQLLKLVA